MAKQFTTAQKVGYWLTWASLAAVIVLAALRIYRSIDISWWWVFAPALIPFGLVCLLVVGVTIALVLNQKNRKDEN